jgi:phosphoenolpyruvate---glycerone phosphotransferase subunit DhaL
MRVDHAIRTRLLMSVSQRVIANAEELTALDRAIGDGDHGINMRRGFEAVLTDAEALSAKTLGDALKGVGTTLVMKVGGASGPLYGTLFMALGKSLTDEITCETVADAFGQAIEAVKLRGKSDVGHKTMLDVLAPVQAAIRAGGEDVSLLLDQGLRELSVSPSALRAVKAAIARYRPDAR